MNAQNKRSTYRVWIGGSFVTLAAAFGLFFMLYRQKTALARESDNRIKEIKAGPMVRAIAAGMSSADKGLTLIGEARPFQSVTLYAKTSGYMNRILVDKGDKVREGQLLATILSPEIDKAYEAALADLDNKRKILKRDVALVAKEYISKEDAEQSETAVKVAEAQVQSLKEQMQYKNLTAPFSGTITARYADVGALVQNATNSQTSAQPVVTLSQLDKIRVYVYIAQNDAAFLKEHYPVTISMTERPDVKIQADVTRIAGELDPKTRMMLVEIDLPNKDNQIIPGSYLQVSFKAPERKDLSIPSEAVVIRGGKYFVPMIGKDSVLHYQQITVGNNDGVRTSIMAGVQQGDIIGVNVSPEVQDGQKVRIQL